MKKILFLIILISSVCFIACGGGNEDNGGAVTYNVGDKGPGGGIIFYVDETGFTVEMVNSEKSYTAHYLETAPDDMPTQYGLRWQYPIHTIGGTGTAIGTGRKNTYLIVDNVYGDTTEAASACVAYRGPNDLSDWFLPSKDQG